MFNSLLLIFLLVLLTVNLTVLARDIRHPSNVFIAAWSGMFALLALGLIDYISVPPLVYLYIALSILFFWLSSVFASMARFPFGPSLRANLIPDNLLLTLGYAGLGMALLYYQTRFGLTNLITNPGAVRSADTGGTGFLGLVIFLPTVVFTVLMIQSAYKKRYPLKVLIYGFLLLVYMAILPERTTLINTLAWTAIGIYAIQSKPQILSWKVLRRYLPRIALLSAVALGFFVAVSARTNKVAVLNNIDHTFNYEEIVPRSLYDPYLYLTGNVPALSSMMERPIDRNELVKFNPDETAIFYKRFIQLVVQDDSAKNALTSNKEFASIPFAFNTYTWLSEPVNDYGLLGSFLYVAFCGALCGLTWSYRTMVTNPLSCYLYGWGATASLFTIMTNKFSSIYFNYAISIVVFLYAIQYVVGKVGISSSRPSFNTRVKEY